jgi:hypothetical protein
MIPDIPPSVVIKFELSIVPKLFKVPSILRVPKLSIVPKLTIVPLFIRV